MKKKILILSIALALVVGGLLVGAPAIPITVSASDNGTVSATVTASLISVTVTPGTVAYGVLATGGSANTTTEGLGQTQTANNTGTVSENFTIKSSDALGGTAWTLAADTGALDEFTHEFSTNDGSSWTNLTDTYDTLAGSIAAGDNQTFDLRIGIPTTVTDYAEHTITVTVLATQS
ncbi:hypothetical protein ACFLUU_06950 [Chloroflexota bacterium]